MTTRCVPLSVNEPSLRRPKSSGNFHQRLVEPQVVQTLFPISCTIRGHGTEDATSPQRFVVCSDGRGGDILERQEEGSRLRDASVQRAHVPAREGARAQGPQARQRTGEDAGVCANLVPCTDFHSDVG